MDDDPDPCRRLIFESGMPNSEGEAFSKEVLLYMADESGWEVERLSNGEIRVFVEVGVN